MNFKNLFSILCIAVISHFSLPIVFAQAPNWLWAKNEGGTSNDFSTSIVADVSGNTYVTGRFFSSTITFGPTTLINADNTAATHDIFISKYDPAGNLLWAKREGGSLNDAGQSISVDAAGNIYVAGYFYSPTIAFGAIILTKTGNYNMFFVKYDPAGNVPTKEGSVIF